MNHVESSDSPEPGGDRAESSTSSRRRVLRAAAVGAGVAVAASAAGPSRVEAGVDGDVVLGSSGNHATTQTTVIHNSNTSNGPAVSAYRTTTTTTGVAFSENAGIVSQTDVAGEAGVLGFGGSGTDAKGMHGIAFAGRGLLGEADIGTGVQGSIRTGNTGADSIAVLADNNSTGTNTIAVKAFATAGTDGIGGSFAGSRAPLLLVPGSTVGAPTAKGHLAGELYVDSAGDLFLCKVAGTPGTWVKLVPAVAAPALHLVTPTRVYDSREKQPLPGQLVNGQNRLVSVANGRNLVGGDVSVPDLVPPGATAIVYNLTIVNTAAQGYLTVNPGGNTTVTSSTVNWYASGQVVATGSTVGINGARQVTVVAGGGGSTDFLIDVVGYYA